MLFLFLLWGFTVYLLCGKVEEEKKPTNGFRCENKKRNPLDSRQENHVILDSQTNHIKEGIGVSFFFLKKEGYLEKDYRRTKRASATLRA